MECARGCNLNWGTNILHHPSERLATLARTLVHPSEHLNSTGPTSWQHESCKVSHTLQHISFETLTPLLRSRDRPHLEEGLGRRRGLREHIRQDAGLHKSDAKGEAGDGFEDTNQEAATTARPNQDVGREQ